MLSKFIDLLMHKYMPLFLILNKSAAYVKYHKPDLYNMLYAPDHHHPSPHGTWMEACVVYCTMLGEMPPRYNVSWWKKACYCVEGLSFPTDGEAEQIRQVSGYVCQL